MLFHKQRRADESVEKPAKHPTTLGIVEHAHDTHATYFEIEVESFETYEYTLYDEDMGHVFTHDDTESTNDFLQKLTIQYTKAGPELHV